MSTENTHSVRNWIVAGGTAAAAIVAALTYFLPRETSATPPPNIEVKAEGKDSIAAGRDVTVKESTTVDKHDYDSDRRRDAEIYLKTAQESCESLAARIAALTANSPFDMANPGVFTPMELEPAEVVAQEYGETVYSDIRARMEQTREDFGPIREVLIANSVGQMIGSRRDLSKERSRFDANKKTWLDNTRSLCVYLSNVKKGGV